MIVNACLYYRKMCIGERKNVKEREGRLERDHKGKGGEVPDPGRAPPSHQCTDSGSSETRV